MKKLNNYIQESLRIGLHDKPETSIEDIKEICNILEDNIKGSYSNTIITEGQSIDVSNIIESIYEYCFDVVGKPRTEDAKKVVTAYETAGFTTYFDYNAYTKSIAAVELYYLKLDEENTIKNIFTNLDMQKIDTKDNNIKLEVYEDPDVLLCGMVNYTGNGNYPNNIDEILLVIK